MESCLVAFSPLDFLLKLYAIYGKKCAKALDVLPGTLKQWGESSPDFGKITGEWERSIDHLARSINPRYVTLTYEFGNEVRCKVQAS